MTPGRSGLAALGLAAVLAAPTPTSAQQVAFQPVVQAFPNGVGLSATPVVSADRRYVRLGVNPQFTAIEGFNTYSVPTAVGGGVGVGGLGGLRSVGMDGPVGLSPYGYGYGVDPYASAILAGGAGYPDRPRLADGLAQVPRPKPKATRAKRGRAARVSRP